MYEVHYLILSPPQRLIRHGDRQSKTKRVAHLQHTSTNRRPKYVGCKVPHWFISVQVKRSADEQQIQAVI